MNQERIPISICFTLSLLGLWLLASTLTFGYESKGLASANIVCSIALFILGIQCRRNPSPIRIWAVVAIGIWLQLAPLLFWAPNASSYVNDTLIGCLLIGLTITLYPIPGRSLKEPGSIPPGWSYNPSGFSQRLPIAFFAFICWMLARYLSAYQLGYIDTVWDPFFEPGTKGVLESEISKAFPISDAGLGAFAYTLEFFSICQGGASRWRTAPWLVLLFGILVIPVSIVSSVLIILQPLAVGTWCTICLATAVCMLIPIPFAIGEVAASIQYLSYSKEKKILPLIFLGGECKGETPDSSAVGMDQPLSTLFKASLSGLTFPWNLSLCTFLGVAIMAVPSIFRFEGFLYGANLILGALIAMVSIGAFAEYGRTWRYLNLLFGLAIFGNTLIFLDQAPSSITLFYLCSAIGASLLSIRRGAVRETFHFERRK